jgi:hypothetical protein
MKTLASAIAVVAALVLASSANSTADFALRPTERTGDTITFTWKRQPGADGYAFLRNGVVVARTMNPSRTSATFWKGSRYAVVVLHRARGGKVTRGAQAVFLMHGAQNAPSVAVRRGTPPLVFVPAPSPTFGLRLVGKTATTVTFAWRPQPGADGYQFLRDGKVVARTMNRSAVTATFWKGSRYAVDVLRVAHGNAVIPFRRAKVFVARAVRRERHTSPRLVFVPAKKIDFRLHLASQTRRTVTFTWKRQPGADGYRFLRNGVLVAQTFDASTTRATFWKGSRYAVEVLRRGPGKRVTAILRALAYTRSAQATTGSQAQKGGARASAPSSSADSQSPTKGAAQAPGASTSPQPKAPTQPKPPSATPAPPPATTPAPAPATPPSVGPGGVVTLSGSYSPSAFFQAVAVAPGGPVTVRGPFTITGDVSIVRAALRIEGATVQGEVGFEPGATGSAFVNGSARGFDIFGADDVLIQGSSFDGGGSIPNNQIWDQPAGNTPDNWKITGNSFSNFYRDDGSHSEALYVGYSTNGLIENNTFTNNGNTSHIFFTWFGNTANPSTSYPRNMCVRGNTFNGTHGAYYDVNLRGEIPTSANIKVQRDATLAIPSFYGSC